MRPSSRNALALSTPGADRAGGGLHRVGSGVAAGRPAPCRTFVDPRAAFKAALRKLQRLGLADREGGGWRLADPEWAVWIRDADV